MIWFLPIALRENAKLQLERRSVSGLQDDCLKGGRLRDVSRTTGESNESVGRLAILNIQTYFHQEFRRSLRVTLLGLVVYICHTEACLVSVRPLEVVQETW